MEISPNIIPSGWLGSKHQLTNKNPAEKLGNCIQGQGHSEGSHCQCICLDDILWTGECFVIKLVWWCNIMSQSVLWKKEVCYLHGHNEGLLGRNMTFYYIFWTADFWQPNMVWYYIIISQNVLWQKLSTAFKVKVIVKGKMSVFVQIISSKLSIILLPNLYCDASSWDGVSCKKIGLLFSRSRSQQRLVWSNCGSFYYILWTTVSFASKLGFVVDFHKPEYLMKKFDCSVQGQGLSKMSKCQWMNVQAVSSEPLNLLLPNLVWWYIIMSQIDFQNNWFVVLLLFVLHVIL